MPLLLTGLLNSVMWFLAGAFVLIWLYLLQLRKELLGSPFGPRAPVPDDGDGGPARHPVGCRPVTERTLVLVKPDGVARGLVGEVITRLERKGLRLVAAELRTLTARPPRPTTPSTASGRSSARSSSSSPAARCVALVVEGPRAIEAFRALAGATDPVKAAPGTIRGDFALEVQNNIVHGSDSPESAEREVKLFFPDLG